MRYIKRTIAILLTASLAAFIYAADAWRDAQRDSKALQERAQFLIKARRGPADLGPNRFDQLIMIQDPNFLAHNGVDLKTPGAGVTTLTQSLAKRTAFKSFSKGLPKIRQTAYAMSLENELTKPEIAALWLESAEMGRIDGDWTIGFFDASIALFGDAPVAISDDQFLTLVSVLIAPSMLQAEAPDAALDERKSRIKRRLAGDCEPLKHSDVWLNGCKQY